MWAKNFSFHVYENPTIDEWNPPDQSFTVYNGQRYISIYVSYLYTITSNSIFLN